MRGERINKISRFPNFPLFDHLKSEFNAGGVGSANENLLPLRVGDQPIKWHYMVGKRWVDITKNSSISVIMK